MTRIRLAESEVEIAMPIAEDSASKQNGARESRYLTTSIPYVNAPPHVGFAMEMIQADSLARFYRLEGHDVRFQAGSDENSLKNVRAAEASGTKVETLVHANAERFRALRHALNLSFDDFVRTSSDRRHRAGVERLWAACAANGDIYRRPYEGLYCTGCEQFYKPSELRGGRCPEHGTHPERICEENYFFRLSRYQQELQRIIASRQIEIVPESRRNEALGWIEGGLEDFSVSRSASRARGWGIPVPDDRDQIIYVWFDALSNYITALDYAAGGENFARFWHHAATREHVIGKGITRFHALYWPAMLLSAGLPLPTRILVHGYVTVEGRKIGKSAGNAIDPAPLAAARGADALRYYLLRHVRSTEDGDFAHERFVRAYDAELAGQLGNLAHRTLSMIQRYCDGIIPAPVGKSHSDIAQASHLLPGTVKAHLQRFAFDDALAAIWSLVASANKYVTDRQPWSLARQAASRDDARSAAAARAELCNCLSDLAMALCIIGQCLAPLLPSTGERLLRQLGLDTVPALGTEIDLAGNRVDSHVLFPKLS
jgi:methionyl-tRNA synthetase